MKKTTKKLVKGHNKQQPAKRPCVPLYAAG